jgi:hypothetical protein
MISCSDLHVAYGPCCQSCHDDSEAGFDDMDHEIEGIDFRACCKIRVRIENDPKAFLALAYAERGDEMTIWDEAEHDALCPEADGCPHCTSVRSALARARKLEEALKAIMEHEEHDGCGCACVRDVARATIALDGGEETKG